MIKSIKISLARYFFCNPHPFGIACALGTSVDVSVCLFVELSGGFFSTYALTTNYTILNVWQHTSDENKQQHSSNQKKSPNVAREKCKNVMIIIKSLSYPTHKYVTGYGSASKAKPNYKYAYGMVRVGNWGASPESVWHYKTHNLQHIVGRGKIENENQIKNTHKHYANGVRNERERETKKFHHIFFLLLGFAGCFLYLFPHRFTVKRRKKMSMQSNSQQHPSARK